MFRTPLKNSKNVNKPFKSPFDSSSTPNNRKLTKSGQKSEKPVSAPESSSSSRALEAKRTLKLDDDEPDNKRQKTVELDGEKIEKNVPENATKKDLMQLKRKIFELRQELDCFKSRERQTKKHNLEDLKASIEKWRSACQKALEIVCADLSRINCETVTILDMLNFYGISAMTVHYLEEEESFV